MIQCHQFVTLHTINIFQSSNHRPNVSYITYIVSFQFTIIRYRIRFRFIGGFDVQGTRYENHDDYDLLSFFFFSFSGIVWKIPTNESQINAWIEWIKLQYVARCCLSFYVQCAQHTLCTQSNKLNAMLSHSKQFRRAAAIRSLRTNCENEHSNKYMQIISHQMLSIFSIQ